MLRQSIHILAFRPVVQILKHEVDRTVATVPFPTFDNACYLYVHTCSTWSQAVGLWDLATSDFIDGRDITSRSDLVEC